MDESKLIFFTGAPGSKWSAISYLLAESPLITVSKEDRNNSRIHSHGHKFNNVEHVGSYFGPGFEYGHKFHDLKNCSKEYVIKEIKNVFSDSEMYKVIRCHQFVYNLDWIKENFPQSKIIVIMRHNDACWLGWLAAGGFGITYPDYLEYYKNEQLARKLIDEECLLAKKWLYKENLEIHTSSHKHWTKVWNLDTENFRTRQYLNSTIGHFDYNTHPENYLKYDVQISYYNFGEINAFL